MVLWVPNEWRTFAYYFAIWKLGGVVVPFDREMNPEAGTRILASVEPRAVLVGYGERPAWSQGVSVEEWWIPGSRSQAARELPTWTVPNEQLAALMFTSGTNRRSEGLHDHPREHQLSGGDDPGTDSPRYVEPTG